MLGAIPSLRRLFWIPILVACGDDSATDGGGGADPSGGGGGAQPTAGASSSTSGGSGAGGGSDGGGTSTWERATGAFIVDFEVAPDGGAFIYALGSEQDLEAEAWTQQAMEGDPGLVAKLSATGETEWTYPIATGHSFYNWLAVSPSGGVAVTIDGEPVRVAYLESGSELWSHPLSDGGSRFDFDATSQLWTSTRRFSAAGVEAHASAYPFASLHAVESHLVYGSAATLGADPHLESYELDGTTLRFDIAATMMLRCDGCWASVNPVQLGDGTTVVVAGIVDSATGSVFLEGEIDWGCGSAEAVAVSAFDDQGVCLWSKPFDPDDLSLLPSFGPSGNDVLVPVAGELQLWSGQDGSVLQAWPQTFPLGESTPNGPAVYTREAVPNAHVLRRLK